MGVYCFLIRLFLVAVVLNFHMAMPSLNNSMLPSPYLLLDNLTIIYNFVIGCQVEREKTMQWSTLGLVPMHI